MQAALMLRSKSRVARRRKLKKLGGRLELPSNVATKEIAPFPRYPPESWCAHGRAAWLDRQRQSSAVQPVQNIVTYDLINKHEHYLETNVGLLSILRGPSTFANAILYFGLCTTAIGLIIAFVGTGEKGFKTGELRLIGPSLIGFGLASCFIRIMLCICPSKCISSDRSSTFEKELDHSTKLLQIKECDILAKSNIINTTTSSNSKLMEGGFETLKQIATSSIFMQNELKSSKNKISPFIHNRKQLQNDDMCSTHKSNNENHWSILPQPFFYKIPQIQNKITAESTSKAVDAKMNNEPVELISLKSLSINEKEIVLSPSCLQNIE
ncbi:hypothetical protein ACFFRR_005400 [Megaselia abdita]